MNARVCYDWSALGYHEDPIPGDPEQVEATAGSYASTSDTILQVSDYLAKLDADGQQSLTITALKARSRELSGQLQSVSTRYTETAAALRYYAPELRQAQAMADAAIAAGGPADARCKSAKSNAFNLMLGWRTSLEPTQAKQFEESYFVAKSQADSAAADVAHAKGRILEAIKRRDTAADAAKSMIHSAIENSPVTDTLLDKFKEVLDTAVDLIKGVGQWIWDNIDTIALVLTIVSVVFSFIPGLNLIAPAVALLAQGATILAKIKTAVETVKSVVKAITTGDVSGLVAIGASAVAGWALGKFTGILTGAASNAAKSAYGKALHALNKKTSKEVWGKLSTIVTGNASSGLTKQAVDKALKMADTATKKQIQTTLKELSRATVADKTITLIGDLAGGQVKDKLGDLLFSSSKEAVTNAVAESARFQTDVLINTVKASGSGTGGSSGRGLTGGGGGFTGGGSSGGW